MPVVRASLLAMHSREQGDPLPLAEPSPARYCRRCGIDLGAEWPRALWESEASGWKGGRVSGRVVLGQAELIYDLDADPRLDAAALLGPDARRGGRAVLGILRRRPDAAPPQRRGRADRQSHCDLDRLAEPGSSPARLRSSGPWMTATTEAGIRAIDLIGVDDLADHESWSRPVWSPRKEERLAAGPVLLPSPSNPMARIAVWVVAGPDGTGLGVAPRRH